MMNSTQQALFLPLSGDVLLPVFMVKNDYLVFDDLPKPKELLQLA